MNRREFTYLTAMAAAAKDGSAKPAIIPESAGLISEMVFLDDCVRVAMYDPGLSNAQKSALAGKSDHVHDGALAPEGSEYVLAAGKRWSEALRRHRRPDSAEARLYQDVAVVRDVSAAAGCNPDTNAPVGDLLETLHLRRRLAMHTLVPDDATLDDVQAWVQNITTWWREQRSLLSAIASCYTSPDPAKMREFAAGFYDAKHPLIRLARGYENGEVAPKDTFAAAMDAGRRSSGYARALADAIESLHK